MRPIQQVRRAIIRALEGSTLGRGFLVNRAHGYYSSHSQFGEDMAVRSLLEGVRRGTYVDVGAHHPVNFSNTYHFYLKGWSGVAIDANGRTASEFRRLRPRDVFVECLVSDVAEERAFFEFDRAAFDTADPNARDKAQTIGARLLRTKHLRAVRLADLLDRHLDGRVIHYLNVDVEGRDLSVLQSNDWRRFRPMVVSVEDHGFCLDSPTSGATHGFLKSLGYQLAAKCGPTLIFAQETRGR